MMKKLTILLGFGALWFAGAASAGDIIWTEAMDARICSDGAPIYGVTESDVTGEGEFALDCAGTFDGNDPGPGSAFVIGDGDDEERWEFVTKLDIGDGGGTTLTGIDIGLVLTGLPGSYGTWSYDETAITWDAFIIVIKAADHPGYALYLMDGTWSSGTWQVAWSPNGNGDPDMLGCIAAGVNCANISHISIYAVNYRVPEPGTAALLGLSLIGLGMARRRRQS